ncbi:MAG: tRNA uridine-5-carboxymethylaminomethyl(34) synthesis GTPase MnmE [Desulfuromonadales bacterium]|nr:tRNA uridine-5-carboxymethylaminomethyl(34) synthesis GTPase MnmE [Desulfuromonadales bacterium]
MNCSDTIVAPATPPGEGGLAVVRLSGPDSLAAVRKFFRPSGQVKEFASHHLYHGFLADGRGQNIDEVMVVYMQPPRSYTCEEVVEVHCHGGQQIVRAILDLFLSHGLRLAQPGEFTYRAFMNGRLDLTQAEAVARLIHSRSEAARVVALSQVEGRLSRAIHLFTEKLRRELVLIEAWIDFPEEDIPTQDTTRVRSQIYEIIEEISILLNTFETGRVFVEGASILLIGRPNAGKSSLLNALLGEERAIVTDIPGTTRDTLEEGLTIGGIPVRLIDTAGFRDSCDPVELEGVRRAKEKILSADLVLLLVDGSRPCHEEDLLALQACAEVDTILVVTKSDLGCVDLDPRFAGIRRVAVSAKTGDGLGLLREAVTSNFGADKGSVDRSVIVTEKRHNDALLKCRESLQRIIVSLDKQASLEFISSDLRDALGFLSVISGETTTEDILGDIFSSFCIGK